MRRPVPITMQCGPDPATGWPRFDFVLDDGHVMSVVLDPAHARSVARRLDAITSGAIADIEPSRRLLQIDLGSVDVEADTKRPTAAEGARR